MRIHRVSPILYQVRTKGNVYHVGRVQKSWVVFCPESLLCSELFQTPRQGIREAKRVLKGDSQLSSNHSIDISHLVNECRDWGIIDCPF
jgi:hypothetical protein